ncbi:MAG: asparagine synthase-related protein [Burkholderiales bacterium]
MSAIAGIARFDGAPVAPGALQRMTAAMRSRGPDGVRHWAGRDAALGHCMLRTTPESLAEDQPLSSADGNVVLVMDGRVDNAAELRRELLACGAVPRDDTDAELVLQAYLAWGEDCPRRIVGEFAFFAWDARERRLFAARDAAGTRHFHYHAGEGWFAFASDIAGLLALGSIAPRLNETRLLDYLSDEYDRDDEVGTFYRGIDRLPAGHAMRVDARGVRAWRYWDPAEMPALRFGSLAECAEAFLEQFRVAVKCRLRSNGPVGAMLSGGLDSSSIVALISREMRGELRQPLQTYSLVLEERDKCLDWAGIREVLKDDWLDATVITSSVAREVWRSYVDGIPALDEPFGLSHGFTDALLFEAARQRGCRVLMDGMASDLYYYGATRSLGAILREGMLARLPGEFAAWRRHGEGELRALAWTVLHWATPEALRALYRKARNRYGRPHGDMRLLRRPVARDYLAMRRAAQARAARNLAHGGEQHGHARHFTTGMLSFAHEVNGQIALSKGVEPRSPFSDRRMLEFAVRMPLEAKLYGPWYKLLLRTSMAGILPEPVRWRRKIEGHPGWQFHEQLVAAAARHARDVWDPAGVAAALARWVDPGALQRAWRRHARKDGDEDYDLFRLAVLARWLGARPSMA